jgi:SNF family Na+-dependent transporter
MLEYMIENTKTIEAEAHIALSKPKAKLFLYLGWIGVLGFTALSFYYPHGYWSIFIVAFAYIAGVHHGYVSPQHFFRQSNKPKEPNEGIFKLSLGVLGWVIVLAIVLFATVWRLPIAQ